MPSSTGTVSGAARNGRMFQKAIYLVQEAFRTIRRHKGVTTISVIIMSLSLLMLAVFLLATDNLLMIIGHAEQEIIV